ncbi:MAG: hypothetical protein DHS20C18_38470 [Saprospiraceae bacterium]|nr:MAG: hypothetical protein DHS20C18_38470 [Saprospiraceae bacterium]
MEISINQLIIHELIKEAEAGEATLYLTETAQPVNDQTEDLLMRLNATFEQKEDILHGYLSPPEDALFPGYFQQWQEGTQEEEAFVAFSKNTMNALQEAIQGVIGAKGGYLVYADYQHFHSRILGIFLVRDTDGIVFKKQEDQNSFDLHNTTYLNTEKLAMACRIHIDKSQSGQGRFVELIKHARSQKEISEYFLNWIGLEGQESSKNLTHTFLEVVSQLPLPVDETSGEMVQESQFREQVLNFAMRSPQKTISIAAFDDEFYGEQKTTQQFLETNDIPLDPEFRFDRPTMKKFFNFRLSAEGISLSFNRNDYLDKKVSIEEDRIVIHSPAMLEKLLAMLEE